jgi:hypothetical protein
VRQSSAAPGERRLAGAGPDQHEQEAELADRAEGEQPLEVGLPQRPPAADDHREQADGQHQRPPGADDGEGGRQPGDQVDAGLDHRRGVQVGRHRRGGGHRRGSQGWNGTWALLVKAPTRISTRASATVPPRGGSARIADSEEVPAAWPSRIRPTSMHEPAERGHEQRLLRRPAAVLRLVVEADEQVRRDAGQLPEDVEQDQVVGEDEPEHRAGEAVSTPANRPRPGCWAAK